MPSFNIKKIVVLLILLGMAAAFALDFFIIEASTSLSISPQIAEEIGERIWKNECGGNIQGLTHWNKGESFASLGIGHFIWYSANRNEVFQESFPGLLVFLEQHGAELPAWLKNGAACPWNTREEFYGDIESPIMQELRQFLFKTKSLQALFMAHRLEKTLPYMLSNCPIEQQKKIRSHFFRLAETSNGLYALIDYLNFKGAGTSSHEAYNGRGWGLLQVLQEMPSYSHDPLVEFVNSAKNILWQRVKNSPPERQEERWLPGWLNRLDTYNP